MRLTSSLTSSLCLLLSGLAIASVACGGDADPQPTGDPATKQATSDAGAAANDASPQASGDSGADTATIVLPSSACTDASARLCQRACECGPCVIARGTTITEQHDSRTDCENYYAYMVCPSAPTSSDFAACKTSVDTAACVSTSKGNAIPFPSTCDGLKG
jgi:hypothetical protein